MASKNKRWGKEFKDTRNWKNYNQHLINRGEFFINPLFLKTWIEEIKYLNSNKVGQPFLYPDSLIKFLAMFKAKGFDYRSLEGIAQGFSKKFGNFPIISFSQIRRRISKLKLTFNVKNSNLLTGTDGSGFKVSNRGEWIRQKWKIRRGWVKVVILGDSKGNVIDIEVNDEKLDENKASKKLLKRNHKKIDVNMGDGLYDTKENFELYHELDIKPVIKIRKDASTRARGSLIRKKQVVTFKKLGYKEWARINKYGLRWVSTEGIFSAVKRIFGETLSGNKPKYLYKEAKLKFWAYQKLRDLV
ncbi:MAG: IS5 family transposase [Candidatus Woesearchaeota archaeon]